MTREHPNADELLRIAEINGGLALALQRLLEVAQSSTGIVGYLGNPEPMSWGHFWEVDVAEKALKKHRGEAP